MDEQRTHSKPVLIYDGDCGFCKFWMIRWRYRKGDAVDYVPFQETERVPEGLDLEALRHAVHFVDADGHVSRGAEAVFRFMSVGHRRTLALWAYESIPGVRPTTETAYRIVASHRDLFGKLNTLLIGRNPRPTEYLVSRWLFLRLLALVYLIAFASLAVQVRGLAGVNGIAPAQDFIDALREIPDGPGFLELPTLAWFGAGDVALLTMAWGGAVIAICAIAGLAPPFAFALLWILYLSLVNAGHPFLAFQWDALLLEAGFIAIFFAPWRLRSFRPTHTEVSVILRLLYYWLLFRLMFASGVVKLPDETWKAWTALTFHYETQPLPPWTAWYAHHLPVWFHKASVAGMFFIELVVPFFIFGTRPMRRIAAVLIILFQLSIAFTGNYGFFNLLSIALAGLVLDDEAWLKLVPRRARDRYRVKPPRAPLSIPTVALHALVAGFLVLCSSVYLLGQTFPGTTVPWGGVPRYVQPFHLTSPYGLFARMTTSRPEIIIEGSDDGETWKAYEFKWKPGNLSRRPKLVQPHMPRLDWQMWFAALGDYRMNPWLMRFMGRLLEGSPDVLALLEENPFPEEPPRFVRATTFEYQFTTPDERRRTGNWWRRDKVGPYMPVMEKRRVPPP